MLSERERATLFALADAFVPRAPEVPGLEGSATDLETPARIEQAIASSLPPRARRDTVALLKALGTRAGGLALHGRASPFAALSASEREAALLRMAESDLAIRRRAFAGLRKLVGFLHYTDPRVRPALGYADPPASPDPPAAGPALPTWDGAPVDVVVVGSGAGGGVAAAVLARAGRRVLIVEAGPLRGATDFDGDEARGNRDLYEMSGAFQSVDESLTLLAGRAAGGGTTINWMTSLAPPIWLRSEWEAAGIDGCAGAEFDAHVRAVESRARVSTDESTLNGANRVLAEGATKLGWREGIDWRRVPRNAQGCRDRCAFCVFGCPWNAKQGTLVTWLADAAAAGARFLFDSRVERVLLERGCATGVRLAGGREIRARTVVLAGGAVRTAALLLASGIRSRGVGRLFVHPTTSVVATFPERIAMWAGPPQSVAVTRFDDLDGRHHGVILETAPGHPGLAASTLPWRGGAAAKRDMARLARTAAFIAIAREEQPGWVSVARDGTPVVHHRVGKADARRILRGLEEASRVARAAGAETIATLHASGVRIDGPFDDAAFEAFLAASRAAGVRPHGLGLFSAHQMGTCALGRDGEAPADGKTGRVWDAEGLYVCDGSAFPSPSGVNPMISIQALAHRTATRLAARGM